LEDSINYSLYLPSKGPSSPGSFLDEERTFQDYCLEGHVPKLEFRPICRDYGGTSGLTEKKVMKNNTKPCLKKFVDHVRKGEIKRVEKMLSDGLDPNFITEDSNTPLGIACGRDGRPTMILTLVRGGANFTFRGKDGLTPLHRAAIGGNNDAIDTLMNQGASPNYKDAKVSCKRLGLLPLSTSVNFPFSGLIVLTCMCVYV
jgi:SH3/ankyrin repeat-containing protein